MKNKVIKSLLKIGLIVLPVLPILIQKEDLYITPAQIFCIHNFEGVQREVSVDSLVENCDNHIRTVARLDELTGQRQLVNLCHTVSTEESWIFDLKSNKWVETGICQRNISTLINYRLVDSLLTGICEDSANLMKFHFYHLHPFNSIDEIPKKYVNYFYDWAKECDPSLENDPKRLNALMEKWRRCSNIRPTYMDIRTSISYQHKYNNNGLGYKQFRFRIASELGITEYSLTESVVDIWKEKGVKGIDEYTKNYDKKNERFYKKIGYEQLVRLSENEICWRIEQLLSDDTVCVSFYPIDSIKE